jgi:hypothetical protein
MPLLDELGIEAEDLRWWHLNACNELPLNPFFDDYESDEIVAKNVDLVCLSCPVIKQCGAEGFEKKERGTWGGVFLHLGRVDKLANDHKTDEVWEQLEEIHGRKLR